jgi:signal transduction histidine kinase
MEVDRLRRNARLVHEAMRGALGRLRDGFTPSGGDSPSSLTKAVESVDSLLATLRDLRDPPGYHPSFDQVIAIAVRPLMEQLFRWHQRLLGADSVEFRLALDSEHVEWFPGRLRTILDNLISNALKYRDSAKSQSWVRIALHTAPESYQFEVSDNGVGLRDAERDRAFDLVSRAGPLWITGVGVGLPVVKLLVEQSGGTLAVEAGEGQGTTFRLALPRFEVDDFLI